MSEFVICLNNDSSCASLPVGKVARALPDVEAQSHKMQRVIDEDKSEPDSYLAPHRCLHQSNCQRPQGGP